MTTQPPAPQLALIALSEAAVQGEWTIGKIYHDGARIDCGDWEQVAYVWQTTRRYVPGDNLDATGPEFGVDNPQANAEFIAALVNWFRANYTQSPPPEAELPELPEPAMREDNPYFGTGSDPYGTHNLVWYSADQMRAYAESHAAYWREMHRAANARGDGWLPIESAPKDGTVVLYCDARGNRWSDCSPGVLANGCGYPPTVWRHLPLPPASISEVRS